MFIDTTCKALDDQDHTCLCGAGTNNWYIELQIVAAMATCEKFEVFNYHMSAKIND